MKPRFLVAEPDRFSPDAVATLARVAEVVLAPTAQADLPAALQAYDGIWVRLALRFDTDTFRRAGPAVRCRTLVTATTGTDHIDAGACARHGIRVFSLRGHHAFLETVRPTAEHTLGLLLALARHLPAACRSVLAGGWERDRFRGLELFGRTAGIVGYGRLGRAMAGYLQALGMRVLAHDPHVDIAAQCPPGITPVPALADLLRDSDVVCLHVSLSDETRRLFGAAQFAALRPGALLVNTARGQVIDEAALLAALRDGRLGGAALDVLDGEPAITADHALVRYAREHDNLLITPHIGGAAHGVMERCEAYLAGVVAAALEPAG